MTPHIQAIHQIDDAAAQALRDARRGHVRGALDNLEYLNLRQRILVDYRRNLVAINQTFGTAYQPMY